MRVRSALAVIERANLLPAAADQLRASAKAGTVHYSTLIEGNELPLLEAERAARGELAPNTWARVELVNYVAALDLLDSREKGQGLELSPGLLLELHGVLMKGLGHGNSHFKPHHEGQWRDGVAVVANPGSGVIMHEGAAREEVPGRIAGLCEWARTRRDRGDEYPPPVVAGVVHYAITDIHPFADGNGRTARLAAAAVLQAHGYLPGRLFSFEGYYAQDRAAYLGALRSVRQNTYNMEEWLAYFLEGLAQEYERVVDEIDSLSKIGLTKPSTVQLRRSQQIALSLLQARGVSTFSRAEYEVAAGIGSSRAKADIADLREKRIIRTQSGTSGPTTRYTFIGAEALGRPRKWTTERIEQELRDFCGSRTTWPSVKEFKNADRWALYLAVSRHGGARTWAGRLGLDR